MALGNYSETPLMLQRGGFRLRSALSASMIDAEQSRHCQPAGHEGGLYTFRNSQVTGIRSSAIIRSTGHWPSWPVARLFEKYTSAAPPIGSSNVTGASAQRSVPVLISFVRAVLRYTDVRSLGFREFGQLRAKLRELQARHFLVQVLW